MSKNTELLNLIKENEKEARLVFKISIALITFSTIPLIILNYDFFIKNIDYFVNIPLIISLLSGLILLMHYLLFDPVEDAKETLIEKDKS